MNGTWYKTMFGLIKNIFIQLLIDIVSASYHTKCILIGNKKCMIQSTLVNLHPNEYSQEFHYYPFAVKLDRCVESCKWRLKPKCVQHDYKNKWIENINKACIIFTSECQCKFDGRKCNSEQWWNNGKYRCECKNHAACICESGQYLASIMDGSTITCDKIIESYNEEAKTVSTNFNEKETCKCFCKMQCICKMQNFYILLVFLLITIALMIAVSI